jgi:transcriptional regulator with XRE-family HTH domain
MQPPAARLDFARRLRELRVPRGFRTARSLARTLDIDENRYTRYERAEVEPDLAMIRRICETLDVTPNDLLGLAESQAATQGIRTADPPPVEEAQSAANGLAAFETADALGQFGLATAAWQIAVTAIQVRAKHALDREPAGGTPSPLAPIGQAGLLYKLLMQNPFEMIGDLAADPIIANAGADDTRMLRQRIDRLIELLDRTASPDTPGRGPAP